MREPAHELCLNNSNNLSELYIYEDKLRCID